MSNSSKYAAAGVAGATCFAAAWSIRMAAEEDMKVRSAQRTDAEEALVAARGTANSNVGATPTLLSDPTLLIDPATPAQAPTSVKDEAAARSQPSISETHPLILAGTGLNDEQKLQVALCRRQAWVRAAQLGPLVAACGYMTCVIADRTRLGPLPRGSRSAVPLAGFVAGMTIGSYLGGVERREMMQRALLERPIAGVHMKGPGRTQAVSKAAADAAAERKFESGAR